MTGRGGVGATRGRDIQVHFGFPWPSVDGLPKLDVLHPVSGQTSCRDYEDHQRISH